MQSDRKRNNIRKIEKKLKKDLNKTQGEAKIASCVRPSKPVPIKAI
jgi:hypothetical protein